jgi:hypothetical protein
MTGGFFAIDRGVWEHPMFAREKFSEREAWIWLISSAAWEPIRIRVGRASFDLARGQCAFALRFLAEKWQWSEPRVRRFLKRLTDDAAVLVLATREATLITICNYDEYQASRRADVVENDAALDAESTNPRRKEERNKQTTINKEEKKETRARARVDDGWPDDFREQFWAKYPNKVGKPKALKKLEGIRKRGVLVDWAELMAGLERYIRTKPPDREWLNPETFLNQERWADEPATVNGHRTIDHRANSATSQSGSAAILAGVAEATERRARERAGPVAQRPAGPVRPGHAAEGTDLELFGARDG